MQYLPAIEDSFAKDNVKLSILPFMCGRGTVPLAEYRKIHCLKMLTFISLTTKQAENPNTKPTNC